MLDLSVCGGRKTINLFFFMTSGTKVFSILLVLQCPISLPRWWEGEDVLGEVEGP